MFFFDLDLYAMSAINYFMKNSKLTRYSSVVFINYWCWESRNRWWK